jgi:hypothetical protein
VPDPDWLKQAAAKGLIVGVGPAAKTPAASRTWWAVEFVVPIRPANESNLHDSLGAKLGRKRQAKRATAAALPPHLPPLPVVVTLTRVGGAKRMDDDGLANAMKVVRDCVAAALGVDDGDPDRVRFKCRQKPGWGKARVLVRVESWIFASASSRRLGHDALR